MIFRHLSIPNLLMTMQTIRLQYKLFSTCRCTATMTNSFQSLTIVTEISVGDCGNCGSPKDWNLATP